MSEHAEIWLEPTPGADSDIGRLWCQDNVWGDDAVRYVLASLAEAAGKDRDYWYEKWVQAEARAEAAEKDSERWKFAFAAQSRKLEHVLHIPGVREALRELEAKP